MRLAGLSVCVRVGIKSRDSGGAERHGSSVIKDMNKQTDGYKNGKV